ncbi:TrbI F-type domain-containing protein [Parasutterella secunda]|uniref:TrbI F-type domain-containing protein n=1 Tax=Parasutterella secunda TaxID=626947 RepID=UPI0025A48CCB|nr:TrbI F-type domain-containing protein [Parasutterella secunda]MDM8226282.1 TrbI F-type domain-containing protein [Parasutterella secunda]
MNAKESFNQYLKNVSSVLSIAAFVMGAAALTLSIKHPNSTVIATADIQAVMDAQKLVWVQRMKTGEGTQVLNDSREFQRKLEQVLARLAQDRNVVILDKNAFVAGVDVTDLTEVIMNELDLSASETLRLRQRLENEFFSDFPTMRKDRP